MKLRRTTEDYLKTIYILLSQKTGGPRRCDIAERAGRLPSRQSPFPSRRWNRRDTSRRTTASAVCLTEAGLKIAKATYERHQTFRTLLEDLGVDGKTAAADACLMEHAVSPESYEAIKGLAKRKKADGYE